MRFVTFHTPDSPSQRFGMRLGESHVVDVERVIVIGKPAYRVSAETAMEHVFGFTIFNDLSARDVYRAEQGAGLPLLGKNLAGLAPLGPHIVTRDEFSDPTGLWLTTRVN